MLKEKRVKQEGGKSLWKARKGGNRFTAGAANSTTMSTILVGPAQRKAVRE